MSKPFLQQVPEPAPRGDLVRVAYAERVPSGCAVTLAAILLPAAAAIVMVVKAAMG
jgi:hypothetical protein